MKFCFVFVLVAWVKFLGTEAFIIPDELPSLLSVVYSNIPTIKKGTDSRLGWGFRLGDRADFQFLVELGPQTNTQPLANQGDSSTNKRNTLENLADTLYAQRQKDKQEVEIKKPKIKPADEANSGSDWLKTWSNEMSGNIKAVKTENQQIKSLIETLSNARPGLAEGEIDAKSVIPEDENGGPMKHLYPKYESSTQKIKTETEGALDDVSLD
ncbi:unnamed protein product [Brassicogethes aeneus]|uniref:Secreted protein n=1 Tax=Brassicogethes aeneus TaxID=1431903 RepID=A0A9P0ARX8_BRAAE|nr:unnamed protein product [Brassicogethes aeneus]